MRFGRVVTGYLVVYTVIHKQNKQTFRFYCSEHFQLAHALSFTPLPFLYFKSTASSGSVRDTMLFSFLHSFFDRLDSNEVVLLN